MGTDLNIIVQAETEAERLVKEATALATARLDDAHHLRELRLAALEPPPVPPVRTQAAQPNLAFLRALAAKNKERAIALVLEEFHAAT